MAEKIVHVSDLERGDRVEVRLYGTTYTGTVPRKPRQGARSAPVVRDDTGREVRANLWALWRTSKADRPRWSRAELEAGEKLVRACARGWRGPRNASEIFAPKPFGVGDWVEFTGTDGTVQAGQMWTEDAMVTEDAPGVYWPVTRRKGIFWVGGAALRRTSTGEQLTIAS